MKFPLLLEGNRHEGKKKFEKKQKVLFDCETLLMDRENSIEIFIAGIEAYRLEQKKLGLLKINIDPCFPWDIAYW